MLALPRQQSKIDQDAIEKLNLSIKLLTNPQFMRSSKLKWLENSSQCFKKEVQLIEDVYSETNLFMRRKAKSPLQPGQSQELNMVK